MAKMGIYIPDELWAEMQKLGLKREWSQIACVAFRSKVYAESKRNTRMNVSLKMSLVSRLREANACGEEINASALLRKALKKRLDRFDARRNGFIAQQQANE